MQPAAFQLRTEFAEELSAGWHKRVLILFDKACYCLAWN